MLPTIPQEQAITQSIQHLAAIAESLGDGRPQRIILDARQQLSRHLDAERWNAWAATVNRRARRKDMKRRHQGGRGVRHA